MTLPHNRTDRLFNDWCSRQSFGYFQILIYSCLLARGLCGLLALDLYSLMGAVGFEICGLSLSAYVGFEMRSHSGLDTTKSRRTFLCSLGILKGIELHVGF